MTKNMNDELIWMKFEKVSTMQVAERLFRGRVFQSSIFGIKLKDISPGTMTIVDILENFPYIRSMNIDRGVNSEVLGNFNEAVNIHSLHIIDCSIPEIIRIPANLYVLDITLTRKHTAEDIFKMISKIVHKHTGHLTLRFSDHEKIEGDLFSNLGSMNVSVSFYKT